MLKSLTKNACSPNAREPSMVKHITSAANVTLTNLKKSRNERSLTENKKEKSSVYACFAESVELHGVLMSVPLNWLMYIL